MFEAVGRCLRKYFVVSGRASRAEFWWWQLSLLLALGGILVLAYLGDRAAPHGALGMAYLVLQLGSVVPQITVTTRRLHDIGRSGWWQLIGLVPAVGPLVMLWWMVKPGESWTNRFGNNPLGPQDEAFVAAG